MSFDERKGAGYESPKVQDRDSLKRHKDKDKEGKYRKDETLISSRDTDKDYDKGYDKGFGKKEGKKKSHKTKHGFDKSEAPRAEYAEKDYIKSAGTTKGETGTKPYIEVIEETPSLTGGLSGMNTSTAPPLISSASLRRFSTSGTSGGQGQGQDSQGGFHAYETLQENRLATAAKELKDAAWQRAVEMKDSTLQYAGKLSTTVQRKYSIPLGSWLPERFLGASTGVSTWETYGRKKKQSMQLYEEAEQKLREARAAPPMHAPDLFLEANILKQRALKKAIKAQQLAHKMKLKIDCQVGQLNKTTPTDSSERKMTAWELYGHTKQKASKLRARAEVKEQEARQCQDRTCAAELLEEAARLRKKALATAEEAQAYADGIQRAADDKVGELRKWAMHNEMPGGSSSQQQHTGGPQSVPQSAPQSVPLQSTEPKF